MTAELEEQFPSDNLASKVEGFTLPLVGGGTSRLDEQLLGKRGVVVVFWSSICSHCIRYDGYLNDFQTRYPEVSLLAVAAREGESAPQLLAAHTQRNLTFPILHDAERAVARQWFVRQTPTAFLVDSNLHLVYRGAIDNFKYPQDPDHEPHLDAAIKAMLEGTTPDRPETASFGCPIESVYYNMPKPLDG